MTDQPYQPDEGQPGPQDQPEQAPPPPPQAQPYQQPYGTAPQLRPDEVRTWAALAHFGALLLGFIAPLLVYVIYKDRSPWLAVSSRNALNFNLSWMIWIIVSIITIVGWLVVIPAYYVLVIVGGVKTLNGDLYEYPGTIKFLK